MEQDRIEHSCSQTALLITLLEVVTSEHSLWLLQLFGLSQWDSLNHRRFISSTTHFPTCIKYVSFFNTNHNLLLNPLYLKYIPEYQLLLSKFLLQGVGTMVEILYKSLPFESKTLNILAYMLCLRRMFPLILT